MSIEAICSAISSRASALSKHLDEESINLIWRSRKTYRDHPLIPIFRALINSQADISTLCNTNEAIRQLDVRPEYGNWLRSRLSQCFQIEDFSSAASAMGEIRAGGALLQGGFKVHPIVESHTPTCDFKISFDGQEAYVEVATKQMSGATIQYLNSSGEKSERCIYPGGAPDPDKKGESAGENVGHKFASIKPKARQVPADSVAFLWVDIQDEDWWPAEIIHARPVVSSNGEFYSGGIWQGFYGSRGTPLFERQSTEERIRTQQYSQSYPGLFAQHGQWSAAVLSFRNATIVFEHPEPTCPIPHSLAKQLLSLPGADYSEWWINWPSEHPDELSKRVARTIRRLESLSKAAKYSW